MGIQRLPGPGIFIPNKFDESANSLTGGNIFRMDADGDRCGLIMRVPRAGSIVGAGLCIAAVANAPDNGLQIGRQGLDGSGLPDGTFVSSATTTGGTPSAAGWIDVTFDTPQSVARGEYLCLMVTQGAGFTASDSIVIGAGVMTAGVGFPYAIGLTGGKEDTYIPLIFPRYSDGSYATAEENCWPISALTYHASVREDTTPDEVALAFTSPAPLRVSGLALQGALTGVGTYSNDYDLIVYDAAGRVLYSETIASAYCESSGHRQLITVLSRDLDFAANVEYFVAYRPKTTNANNLRFYYGTFPSAEAMDTAHGGRAWYMATRTDGGAWTRYNNGTNGYQRLRLSLLVTGFSDGATAPRTRPLRRA